ncbi:MAG: RDD family protein [Pseudomonadota bacterium]
MNPFTPPQSEVADPTDVSFEYAGFWIRTGASLIDSVLVLLVTYPLLYAIYGAAYFDDDSDRFIAGPADFLLSWVAPAVLAVWFWLRKQGTPGKLVLSLRVVDARTGQTLTVGQSIGRYLAYFVSALPLGLGMIWVGFDERKQGWHDKLANTVVVRTGRAGTTTHPVIFEKA